MSHTPADGDPPDDGGDLPTDEGDDPSNDEEGDPPASDGRPSPSADRSGPAADRTTRPVDPDDPDGFDESLGIDADDGSLLDAFVADDGEERDPDPIEPGSPSVEHALFVLLGVLGTVAVLVSAL